VFLVFQADVLKLNWRVVPMFLKANKMSNVHPSVTYKRRPNSWIGIAKSIHGIFTKNCWAIPVFSHTDPKYSTFYLRKCTDTHGVHKIQRTMLEILCRTVHYEGQIFQFTFGHVVETFQHNYLWKKVHYCCRDDILLCHRKQINP